MRWRDMRGPIGPIIRLMARYYHERTCCEFDDLQQEAWLAILRRPNAHQVTVAWSAMTNLIAREATRRKYELAALERRGESYEAKAEDRAQAGELLELMRPETRRAAVMMFLEGCTRAETAKALGCPEKTIWRRFAAFRDGLGE